MCSGPCKGCKPRRPAGTTEPFHEAHTYPGHPKSMKDHMHLPTAHQQTPIPGTEKSHLGYQAAAKTKTRIAQIKQCYHFWGLPKSNRSTLETKKILRASGCPGTVHAARAVSNCNSRTKFPTQPGRAQENAATSETHLFLRCLCIFHR